jgi:hypothetical protein
MEAEYVFTSLAFRLYAEIPETDRNCFWEWFSQQGEIAPGELIHHYMVEKWFEEMDLPYQTTIDPNSFPDTAFFSDIRDVFISPSCLWYRGFYFSIPYDFERAEYFYFMYAHQSLDTQSPSFADQWWNYWDQAWNITQTRFLGMMV